MATMKQVRVGFVLVVVAALFAGTRALAGNGYGQKSTYSVKLWPEAADEPNASGVAKVTLSLYLPVSGAQGTVTCKGLTPNADYAVLINGVGYNGLQYVPRTYVFYFTTDARGSGGISYSVLCGSLGPTFGVAGNGELVLTSGGFIYP